MSVANFKRISRNIIDDDLRKLGDSWSEVYAELGDQGAALVRRAGERGLIAGSAGCFAAEEAQGFAGVAGAPLIGSHAVLDLVERLGTPAQKAGLGADLAAGRRTAALAIFDAAAPADVAQMAISASAESGGYSVNATRIAVASPALIDTLVVLLRASERDYLLAIVDVDAAGLAVSEIAAGAAILSAKFSAVRIGSDSLIGGGAIPQAEADRALSLAQLGHSARAVARLEYVLSATVGLAKTNEQNGRPLFAYQGTQFKLADLHAELMVARAYVDDAISRARSGSLTPLDSAMLKLCVAEAEDRIFGDAMQVLGGLAYVDGGTLPALRSIAAAEQLATGTRSALHARIYADGVAQDTPENFDVLTVGRDDSILTEDYQLFRQSMRRFLQKEVEPFCKSWVESGNIPKDVWQKAAASGLLGLRIPLEAGGGGGDALHYIITSEEMGRSSCGPIVGPLFQSDGLADLIIEFGTDEQKATWYPRFLAGEVPAFGVSEPQSGSDVRAFTTVARPDGDGGYVINGQKLWTTFATHADFIFILAKTDPDNPAHMGFFVADMQTPGIEPRRLKTRTYACGDTCEVFLTDVRVPASALVGGVPGQALAMVKKMLGLDRIQVGARAAASADLAYRLTLDFVATRIVFGKPLIQFENTQALLAQIRAELHAARAYIDYAFQRHAQGKLDFPTASVAKLWHPTFEQRAVDRLIQMFGGNGFVSEYTIAHQLLGARADRILGGTDEMQRQTIVQSL